MKRILLASTVLFPGLASAQPVTGPYVSLGAGANIQQNEIVKASPYPLFPSNLNYKFDVGGAGEASAGFGFGNGLRVEAEGDFITNHVRGISGTARPSRAAGSSRNMAALSMSSTISASGCPSRPISGWAPAGRSSRCMM